MSIEPPERPPERESDPDTRDTPAAKAPQLLLNALRRVLRPLARLLLEHGIPFRQAASLLKQVYVDVAAETIRRDGGRASTSRLSLITGIQRKEVKRLHENPPSAQAVPHSVTLGAQLVARWTGDPTFLDAEGAPLRLARKRSATGVPGFDDLVRSASSDIHPRSMLDEWLRIGVVRIAADERIELVTAAFVPRRGFAEKAFYLGRNLHDHLDVAARNLRGGEPPLFERSVHYSALSPAALAELAELAEREGMRLLETLNDRARALQRETDAQESDDPPTSGRMNCGVYFYRPPDPHAGSRIAGTDAGDAKTVAEEPSECDESAGERHDG